MVQPLLSSSQSSERNTWLWSPHRLSAGKGVSRLQRRQGSPRTGSEALRRQCLFLLRDCPPRSHPHVVKTVSTKLPPSVGALPHPSQRPPRPWASPGPPAAGWVPTCSAARPYALMAAPNGLQATAKITRAALHSDNQ